MNRTLIKGPLIAAAVVLISGYVTTARADILYSQPYNGSPFAAFSQTLPDFPAGNTLSFDDFVVTQPGWVVQGVSVSGLEQADPTLNQGVFFQFQSTSLPNFGDTTDPIHPGTEDSNMASPTFGSLFFSGFNIVLNPGTYWITAWVVRPVAGGNWLWNFTDDGSPIGSEFLIQNPGGQLPGNTLGITALVGGSTFFGTEPSDLAFTITGVLAPEPSSIVLLGLGVLCLCGYCSRRAKRLQQAAVARES
jgi:hypothetical protein